MGELAAQEGDKQANPNWGPCHRTSSSTDYLLHPPTLQLRPRFMLHVQVCTVAKSLGLGIFWSKKTLNPNHTASSFRV